MSEITLGHIIPQDWARTFPYPQSKIDHPDNLYSVCGSCNSSYGTTFPDRTLKTKIDESQTLGDWLRRHEAEIRKPRDSGT